MHFIQKKSNETTNNITTIHNNTSQSHIYIRIYLEQPAFTHTLSAATLDGLSQLVAFFVRAAGAVVHVLGAVVPSRRVIDG